MSEDRNAESRSRLVILDRDAAPAGGPAEVGAGSAEMGRGPRLRVRTIERIALVRFDDAAMLVTESDVRAVGEQLDRLVEEGHTRLLLNLSGVRYLSSDVLAVLVRRQERLAASGGSLRLCGLDPLLRDMLRITHLDRVLDVCSDEAQALGLLLA
jgi:anti-sigma B factor antagonist